MDWTAQRRRMVEEVGRRAGVLDPEKLRHLLDERRDHPPGEPRHALGRALRAMLQVPRHLFVDEALWARAYGPGTLPIGHGQTISQAYTVARMTELLDPSPSDTVLEIGTGSGYQAAVLSRLVDRLITLERIGPLADRARALLRQIGSRNVVVRIADGSVGLRQRRTFPRIIVTAGSPQVPPSLIDQLDPGGRMVIPVGPDGDQVLTVIERTPRGVTRHDVEPCGFVPLIGEEGWRQRGAGG